MIVLGLPSGPSTMMSRINDQETVDDCANWLMNPLGKSLPNIYQNLPRSCASCKAFMCHVPVYQSITVHQALSRLPYHICCFLTNSALFTKSWAGGVAMYKAGVSINLPLPFCQSIVIIYILLLPNISVTVHRKVYPLLFMYAVQKCS